MSERNLFTGIVKNENDVTELLVNLMYLDDDFRASCLKKLLKQLKTKDDKELVDDGIINRIEACNIYTQYHTKYGIPDIVIENEHCFFIIENKVRYGTYETENQIENYPYILTESSEGNRVKGIVFLVPQNYNIGVGEAYKKISYSQVYWNEFIKDIRDTKINDDITLIEHVLNCFDNVIEKTEYLERITKGEIELLRNKQNVISETFKLKHLILAWTSAFINAHGFIFGDICDAWYGIGYYFKLNEETNDVFYIGLSPNVSNETNFWSICYLSADYGDNVEWDQGENAYWHFFPICRNENIDVDGFESFGRNAIAALKAALECRYQNQKYLLSFNEKYKFKKNAKLADINKEFKGPSASDVRNVMRLSDKLLAYIKKFVYSGEYSSIRRWRDFQGIGYDFWYNKKQYFLGLSPEKTGNSISICEYGLKRFTNIEEPFGDNEYNQYEIFKKKVEEIFSKLVSNC